MSARSRPARLLRNAATTVALGLLLGAGCDDPTGPGPDGGGSPDGGGGPDGGGSPDGATGDGSVVATDGGSSTCASASGGAGNVAAFGNVYDKAVLHSGFVVGTRGDAAAVVEVSVDGGPFAAATTPTASSWRFALPLPSQTPWKENSAHTIAIRPRDAASTLGSVTTITVRKGANQDINGDGYPDLLIGARNYSPGGHAYVFLTDGACGISGSTAAIGAGGPSASLGGEAGAGNFGVSVALADVNGDGYADAIVGAYAGLGIGKVYVFHAADSGSGMTVSSASPSTTITSAETGSQFGFAIAAGDVDADGYADLMVGAPNYTAMASKTGMVFVFQSSGTTGVTATTTAAGTGGPNARINGDADDYNFGISLASADVSGDFAADLVVGSTSSTNKGQVRVFHSGTLGPGITAAHAVDATTTLAGFDGTAFGGAVALGDYDADGYVDLAVGAHFAGSGAGTTYVFQNSGFGIAATLLSDATAAIPGEAGTGFGISLALGDVNQDGAADLVVGAYSVSKVYLFHSAGASGFSPLTTAAAGANGPTLVLTGENASDHFGASLSVSDVSGDGVGDLLVGADYYSGQKGRAYVFAAGAAGITTTGAATLGSRNTITGESASNRFGSSVQ